VDFLAICHVFESSFFIATKLSWFGAGSPVTNEPLQVATPTSSKFTELPSQPELDPEHIVFSLITSPTLSFILALKPMRGLL